MFANSHSLHSRRPYALVPLQFTQLIGSRVLFPAFSEIVRERPERLYTTIQKARLVQILPYLMVNLAFIFLGNRLIGLLYDARYQAVGSMLELLALGALPQSLIVSYGSVLWAKGQIRTSTILLTVQLAIQIAAIVIGLVSWWLEGTYSRHGHNAVAGLPLLCHRLLTTFALAAQDRPSRHSPISGRHVS